MDNTIINVTQNAKKIYLTPQTRRNCDTYHRRKINCVNCGCVGHVAKNCTEPITSFGLVAFKVISGPADVRSDDTNATLKSFFTHDRSAQKTVPRVKYLLIQRQNTIAYVDILRGKYTYADRGNITIFDESKHNSIDGKDTLAIDQGLLKRYFNELTEYEKYRLSNCTFDQLWDDILEKQERQFIQE